jgi:hypothetical protein
MIEDLVKNAATGHRDCCGDMIHEGDTVITGNGHGRVVWLEGKWWLKFSDMSVEALNRYPAGALRRVAEDGTIGSVPPLVPASDRETIVPGQRNDCPADCPDIVPPIKRSPSVGYINNGTMGQ